MSIFLPYPIVASAPEERLGAASKGQELTHGSEVPMVLSFPRMFSLFNGSSPASQHLAPPAEAPGRQPHPASPPATDSPGFLHGGFAPFEPDLTGEIRQALGEQVARRSGDVP